MTGRAGIAVVLAAALPAAAAAQGPAVSIGTVRAAQSCTTFVMSSGRAAIVANGYGMAAAASWRTWLERDCADNFETIRASLTAALASSGRVRVVARGARGAYTVSATIAEPGAQSSGVAGEGFEVAANGSVVTMALELRDPAGRVVDGGLIARTAAAQDKVATGSFTARATQDGRAVYNQLEQALALAAARRVAFRLVPLSVMAVEGDHVQLNAGAPLLATGVDIQVATRTGRFARYHVVGAGTTVADAEADSDRPDVVPGASATVIEAGSPAANTRRFDRVDLP